MVIANLLLNLLVLLHTVTVGYQNKGNSYQSIKWPIMSEVMKVFSGGYYVYSCTVTDLFIRKLTQMAAHMQFEKKYSLSCVQCSGPNHFGCYFSAIWPLQPKIRGILYIYNKCLGALRCKMVH